jgi:hypothetical protein
MELNYLLRPIVIAAEEAHRNAWVSYDEDGTVILRHPDLASLTVSGVSEVRLEPHRQFPMVRATFDDLNKALSRLANSPVLGSEGTLRQRYEAELERYEDAVGTCFAAGKWEPDYGSYVYDHHAGHLYLVAPEFWHRLALVTSNSTLCRDPEARLSWTDIRARFEGTVVGFAGLSVGGNLLEGWLREARPKRVKLADPDWLELTNFNRCERASLRHAVASRGVRFDARNPYDCPRVSKAVYQAYEQNLVDPYIHFDVYAEALSVKNAERFLLGDGEGEPRIDVLVDEIDDLGMKLELRRLARRHRIDVLMLSDFGHRTQVLWQPFGSNPDLTLGLAEDERLLASFEASRQGDRTQLFACIEAFCGCNFRGDPFEDFVEGRGEQPTGSLPQSGATAQIAGGLGGKELALFVLGHRKYENTRQIVYDFAAQCVF